MISFLQSGIGLPAIDVGHILKESFNQAHGHEAYDLLWGNVAYYVVGMLLALIWVVFFSNRIPGNWIIQGIIYGIILSIAAGLIVAPLVSMAAGDPFGFFYTNTWFPGLVILAGLLMHLGYGIVLTLCLKYSGVDGILTN